jgi:hypothetical protein
MAGFNVRNVTPTAARTRWCVKDTVNCQLRHLERSAGPMRFSQVVSTRRPASRVCTGPVLGYAVCMGVHGSFTLINETSA